MAWYTCMLNFIKFSLFSFDLSIFSVKHKQTDMDRKLSKIRLFKQDKTIHYNTT